MRFDPVGHCIYCGTREGPLTLEHIVPFALGGDLELPAASCKCHEKVTGTTIEQPCLRNALIQLRTKHNLPTRNPKKRPREFVYDTMSKQGEVFKRALKPSDLPHYCWIWPVMPSKPGILQGVSPPPNPKACYMCYFDPRDVRTTLSKLGLGIGESFDLKISMNPILFIRMLAKIAHSFAYALLGKDGFEPFLQHLIINGLRVDESPYTWIGAVQQLAPPSIYHLELNQYTGIGGDKLLGVTVHLCAFLRTPRYLVIVGKERGERFSMLPNRKVRKFFPDEQHTLIDERTGKITVRKVAGSEFYDPDYRFDQDA